jgi:WhiB family transcriptional regulator, redox-sensing transcriptional regulator
VSSRALVQRTCQGNAGRGLVGMRAEEGTWRERAVCRTLDPDELFAEGVAQNAVKRICSACPVRTQCLAYALDRGIEHGIWGGMTEQERRALLRRRPTVTSWKDLLETAQAEYERQAAPSSSATGRGERGRRQIPPTAWVDDVQVHDKCSVSGVA